MTFYEIAYFGLWGPSKWENSAKKGRKKVEKKFIQDFAINLIFGSLTLVSELFNRLNALNTLILASWWTAGLVEL
jgi:hypothetical protein